MRLRKSLRQEYERAYARALAGAPVMNTGAYSEISYGDLLMMARTAGHVDGQLAFRAFRARLLQGAAP